jgi:hypothetical protein
MTAIRRPYFINCVLFTWFLSLSAFAQQLPDSSFYQQSRDNLLKNYKTVSGADSRLYIGAEYIPNGRKTIGFPFFGTNEPLTGSIYYNDALYSDLALQYDLVLDGLIINDFTKSGKIELAGKNVKYFSIPGHVFVFLTPDRSFSSFMKMGYYEQLFSSPVLSVYARHEKNLVFPSNLEDQPRYEEHHFYYAKYNDAYYQFGSKGGLLDILKDKKDQLKKFIRANGLAFGQDWSESIVKTAAFYAQIKN